MLWCIQKVMLHPYVKIISINFQLKFPLSLVSVVIACIKRSVTNGGSSGKYPLFLQTHFCIKGNTFWFDVAQLTCTHN